MESKALEINLKTSRVDVIISEKYDVLPEVMSRYQGLLEGLNVFLEELCHPFKNWQFIVKEARRYALDYLHLLKTHQRGPEAAGLYLEIFLDALGGSQDGAVKVDAADNLLLYLQTIIKDSGEQFSRFLPVINEGFDRIASSEDESFFLFVRSFYQINRLAMAFTKKASPDVQYGPINTLMSRYLQKTYSYWLSEEDPLPWFHRETGLPDGDSAQIREIFDSISHERIRVWEERLASSVQKHERDSRDLLSDLLMLPGYAKLVEFYGEVPQKLLEVGERIGQGNYWKLIFLFHIMNCAGLYSIHEETLREINRTLTWPISHEKTRDVELLIQKTFAILKDSAQRYPGTALNCVVTMGMAIYQTDESELVDYFIDAVVDLGFQTPDLEGIGEDWQVKANATHIQNIRTWLELIEINPKWSKKLLSSLIINLSLEGVFIKDTDLFPRDVTRFLNSDIGPVFNLAKQLTRLFPVYFNDIGAEGLLRDVSTKIDELTMRKDELIHFLRKQSHVESSNQIVGFVEAILDFWRTTKKEVLKPHLPPNIYGQIDPEGPYIDGMHRLTTELFKQKRLTKIGDLLEINEADVRQVAADLSGISHVDLERLVSAIALYKLLHQKYNLSSLALSEYVRQLSPAAFPEIDKLKDALAESDPREKLAGLLDYLASLKETILSPEAYEIREDIYRKRHIAVDIPSMYGSYHERKFDTLGLIFRLESLVNILFEELVNLIDLELITRDTFSHIFDYLKLFDKALKLDGILSWEMERQLDLLARSLEVRGFSFTQFLDIFRGFSLAVNNIVNDCFNNIHQLNLIKILGQLPFESLVPKYKPNNLAVDQEKHAHIVSEIFLRERIATSLGLQQLDLFLSRILTTLHQQADKLPGEGVRLLLNYEPIKAITSITDVNQKISGLIYLGNKGLNLVRLSEQGFPVPPGFIITTETFRCREVIKHYPPAEKNLKVQLARELAVLEKLSGKSFGKPENPLLLSVRSGAPISQPGMMNTFLNVGINVDIVHGIINLTKKDWFAWDCYRRFLQSYGMTFGLQRNDFDDIIGDFKNRLGVRYKRDFTGEQMTKVAMAYKEFILDQGIEVEENPFEQLYLTIKKVFDSWNTSRAKTYRKIIGISDDWGTAVTVQQMVFGNLTIQSGSGVVFTHSPVWPGDMVNLWGDFTLGNQGEDVVSGLVKTLPISSKQARAENREGQIILETHFPDIYHAVRDFAKILIYDLKWGPQEMEFTFESPLKKNFFFLQTRDMAIRERKTVLSFVKTGETKSGLLGHGIGVSGGAMAGRAVFNLAELHQWRELEPKTPLILVRGDTVPDDIAEIYEADGLLTGRGGSTSHAAIVAHRLEKTCVVGCASLICMEKESACSIDHTVLRAGDWVSIDGREGSVYQGKMEIEELGGGG